MGRRSAGGWAGLGLPGRRERTIGRWRWPWRPLIWLLILLLWWYVPVQATAPGYEGRVVKVIDGDTVETLDSAKHTERVRISGIDAPERNQAFGTQAKQRLTDLVGGRTVSVYWNKRDRYGRIVGKVVVEGQDAGLTMVREGYAWWYRKYTDEQNPADRVGAVRHGGGGGPPG